MWKRFSQMKINRVNGLYRARFPLIDYNQLSQYQVDKIVSIYDNIRASADEQKYGLIILDKASCGLEKELAVRLFMMSKIYEGYPVIGIHLPLFTNNQANSIRDEISETIGIKKTGGTSDTHTIIKSFVEFRKTPYLHICSANNITGDLGELPNYSFIVCDAAR